MADAKTPPGGARAIPCEQAAQASDVIIASVSGYSAVSGCSDQPEVVGKMSPGDQFEGAPRPCDAS